MRKPGNSHKQWARIDTLFALGFATGAFLWVNEPYLPRGGIGGLLGLRITLMSAAFSVGFAMVWRQCFTLLGLYRADLTGVYRLVVRTAGGSIIMTTLLCLYLDNSHSQRPVGKHLLQFLAVAFGYQVCRLLVCNLPFGQYVGQPERVIILGSGPRASRAWRELRMQGRVSKRLVGFVDDRDPASMPPDIASRFLGDIDSLSGYLLRNPVDELIVATPMRSCYEMTQRAITIAESAGVRLAFLNDVYTLTHEKKLRQRSTMLLEFVPKDSSRESAERAKRLLDVAGAAMGLVLLAPLFLAAGAAIKLTSRGPVFSAHERYGYRRRRFNMYRFRSMVRQDPSLIANLESESEAYSATSVVKDDPRVTRLGRFLRRSSLCELPQLWNVLLGDMSLVGPRPMSVHDVSLFSETQLMRRFSVRPGITGIWQISGLSSFSFDQWVLQDFSYIDQWSLVLDLKILARTVPAVLKRSGAV